MSQRSGYRLSPEGASFEERRSAYLAEVLNVDVRRVLSAMKAWNGMKDAEKVNILVPDEIQEHTT